MRPLFPNTHISPKLWAWARLIGCALTLAVLVWRLGTGPFLDGLRTIDSGALAAAAGLAVLTTVSYAWRWKIVARGLGVDLPLPAAVAAYYRSMFLNATLPGGIIGDLHRGASHGRDVHDLGRALRSVGWERFAGQVVQVVLTVILLLALPSPVQSAMPLVAIGVVVAVFGLVLVARARPDAGRSIWARLLRGAAGDLRQGLLARTAWPAIALTSVVGTAGHVATFLIAAHTVGVSAPMSQILPLSLLVMAAMLLPSVGAWGPREGVTAWAFTAFGLGAQRGIATTVAYGVLVLAASLPGAAVLVTAWVRRHRAQQRAGQPRNRSASALSGWLGPKEPFSPGPADAR